MRKKEAYCNRSQPRHNPNVTTPTNTPTPPIQPSLKERVEQLEWWQKLVGIVVVCLSVFFGTKTWVESTAEKAVTDEKFLAKLSAQVRPSCIVTSKGAIEADFGAMEHLDDVRVILHPQVYGFELVINPKHHLAYAPLIRALDSNVVPTRTDRGPKYQWSISMLPQTTAQTIISADEMDTNRIYRFMVEILH
jgi:hypothetical protein